MMFNMTTSQNKQCKLCLFSGNCIVSRVNKPVGFLRNCNLNYFSKMLENFDRFDWHMCFGSRTNDEGNLGSCIDGFAVCQKHNLCGLAVLNVGVLAHF